MARCPAIKATGERCKADAIPGAGWCFSHDLARAAERRSNASKGGKRGGRGRGSGELAEIKTLLTDLTNRVLGKEDSDPLGTGAAAVANQLNQTRLRAIEIERKIKETDELEERIEQLEQKGGERWRA
jgi:hypothetical protein